MDLLRETVKPVEQVLEGADPEKEGINEVSSLSDLLLQPN